MSASSSKLRSIYRGDTKRYKFSFLANGIPIDITDWTLWFTLKIDEHDSDNMAILQVQTTAGDNSLDEPVNGIMFLVLTSIDTDPIDPGLYYYDFQRVVPQIAQPDDVKTIIAGQLKILVDVTRST